MVHSSTFVTENYKTNSFGERGLREVVKLDNHKKQMMRE